VTALDPVRRPGEFVSVEADDAMGAAAAVREVEVPTVVLRHDHLLVPAERADEAIEVLCALRY
jgi:hypothetical protein